MSSSVPRGVGLRPRVRAACKDYGAPVRLWDLSADFPSREPKRLSHVTDLGNEHPLLAIAFNADETRLAVAYGYVTEVWDLTQENPPQHVVGTSGGSGGWIRAVGLSPDNRWLAIGSSGSDVMLRDLMGDRQEPIVLKGHSAGVNSVVFSDDGRWLATGGDDATARLWDLADPTIPSVLLRGQDLPVGRVIISPGAEPRHLVTVGDEPHARLWNIPDPLNDPVVLRGRVKRYHHRDGCKRRRRLDRHLESSKTRSLCSGRPRILGGLPMNCPYPAPRTPSHSVRTGAGWRPRARTKG